MIYVTDGGFEGILAAVFEAFRNREDPEEITLGGDFQLSIAAGIRNSHRHREVRQGLARRAEQNLGEIP